MLPTIHFYVCMIIGKFYNYSIQIQFSIRIFKNQIFQFTSFRRFLSQSNFFFHQDELSDKKTIGNNKVNGNSILAVPGGGDSPLGNRKRSGSTGEESNCRIGNGSDVTVDFDLLKQELVLEIRKEINRVKQEIIEGNITK